MHRTHNPATEATEGVTTPADLLRGAALYIARHGFHQDDMFANLVELTPPACVIGAIRMAACGSATAAYTDSQAELVNVTLDHLSDHIRTTDNSWRLGEPDFAVADWSDEPTRTAKDVIATLNAAAGWWDRTFGGAE